MSISHRTHRLRLVGSPAIEKLQSDRYRITFSLESTSPREDWYSANKGRIFADYGSLQSTEFAENGCEPRTGEAYPDMRLTEAVSKGDANGGYSLTFVYETLGDTFVAIKDDDTDYEMNGLRRVTRTIIAKAGTDYTGVVGDSSISHQINDETAVTCYLGKFKISDTESSRTVEEVYLEHGILSETLDNVGSQKSKVIQSIGADPTTPDGYVLASKNESDFEGFQTNQFTFLKPSVLSRNVETRNNGKLRVETVEAFNETPTSTIGGVQISIRESDVEGIPTNQYVFALGLGEVERSSQTKNQGALTITTVVSLGFPGTATGVEIEATTKEEDGYTIFSNVFADGQGEVSRTVETRNQGKLTITTVEALGGAGTATGVEIEATTRKQDGYTLFRNTFAQGSGVISIESEKRYEGSLVITTTTSLGVPSGIDNISSTSREEDGYALFINVGASGSGIISSSTEERNNGVITINRIVSVGSPPSPSGTIISRSEKKSDGHTVYDYTGVSGAGQISSSSKPGPTQMPGSTYVTVRSVGSQITPPGVIVAQSVTQDNGYVTYETTALSGSIGGVKATYRDIVDVEVPGTVSCTTTAVSISDATIGSIGGTIAIPNVTPPKSRRVEATVTVEITTSPPNTGSAAYNLGEISCSVTSTNENYSSQNGPVKSYKSGIFKFNVVDWQRSFSPSARIQAYPGCYLTSSSSAGLVSFQSGSTNVIAGDGGSIETKIKSYSVNKTSCTGTGSTSATGYSTSGVINRVSRPVLTDLSGNTYYEVVTWRSQ